MIIIFGLLLSYYLFLSFSRFRSTLIVASPHQRWEPSQWWQNAWAAADMLDKHVPLASKSLIALLELEATRGWLDGVWGGLALWTILICRSNGTCPKVFIPAQSRNHNSTVASADPFVVARKLKSFCGQVPRTFPAAQAVRLGINRRFSSFYSKWFESVSNWKVI